LFAIRLSRCVQSQLRLRGPIAPWPPHCRIRLGRRRLSRHRPRRDLRDDRKLSQRDDLGRDAQESVRASRPDARRLRRRLAHRVRAVTLHRSFRGAFALLFAACSIFAAGGCTSRSSDPNVATSSVVDPRDYFSGIWDTNRVGGKLYGVPWYVDTRLLFYRRDLLQKAGFDAPPRSWREWTATLDAIKARGDGSHFGILLPVTEFEPLVALALQQDDPLLRDEGRFGNFESAGFTRALQFYVDMSRSGYAPPS